MAPVECRIALRHSLSKGQFLGKMPAQMKACVGSLSEIARGLNQKAAYSVISS